MRCKRIETGAEDAEVSDVGREGRSDHSGVGRNPRSRGRGGDSDDRIGGEKIGVKHGGIGGGETLDSPARMRISGVIEKERADGESGGFWFSENLRLL